jgi:hypothetical protein
VSIDADALLMLASHAVLGGPHTSALVDAGTAALELIDQTCADAESRERARITTAEHEAKIASFRPLLTRARAAVARAGYHWSPKNDTWDSARQYVTGSLTPEGVVIRPTGYNASAIAEALRREGFDAEPRYQDEGASREVRATVIVTSYTKQGAK